MNHPHVNEHHARTHQVIYSNAKTAHSLIEDIKKEKKKIADWEADFRKRDLAWTKAHTGGYLMDHPFNNTAIAKILTNQTTQANQRIVNYKKQLARLVVHAHPKEPLPVTLQFATPRYPAFPVPQNPFVNPYGSALISTAGAPYFDQFGRPYPYAPFGLYF
jgi:hypothetical protein